MKIKAVTLALLFVFASSVWQAASASAPPKVPVDRLQPAVAPGPNPVLVPAPAAVLGAPYYTSMARLQNSTLSGVPYREILKGLQTRGASASSVSDSPNSRFLFGQRLRLAGAPDATPAVPPINITGNSAQDAEPSNITITASSVDRSFTSFIEYTPNPSVRYSSTTSFSAPFNNNAMPSTGYTYGGDPAMAENYSTGGQGAQRVYCAGIAFNASAHPETGPNAIVVWHSDPSDSGSFTASPTIVDSRYPVSPAAYFLDKPSLAVSWHNSTDLGYVYVAYVSYDYPYTGHAGNTAIVVATSTNGGATFTVHSPLAYGGSDGSGSEVFNPQIVVSSSTGTVWVMWLDHSNSQIQAASSTDYGSTFGSHEVAASTSIYLGTVTGNIRANTVPNARYNAAAGNIDLTWHHSVGSVQNVEYAYRDGTGWHRPASSIVQYTSNNAFMPALDYNSSGNVVITYYYQPTSGTAAYRAYEAYISSTGTRIDASDHDMAGFDSTPGGNDFIGDYQSVWDWTFSSGEKATASWIGVSSSQYDTYLSRISY